MKLITVYFSLSSLCFFPVNPKHVAPVALQTKVSQPYRITEGNTRD
jgi:hypothetical protein